MVDLPVQWCRAGWRRFHRGRLVTIPAGQSSQTFTIQTLLDQLAEGSELYNIRIDSITGGNFERFEVNPAASNVDTTIVDATQLTVDLIGDSTVAEGRRPGTW